MTFFWIDVESSQVQAGLSVFQISNYSVSPLHTQKKSHGGNWRVLHNWKNCKWSFMKNCRKNEAFGSKYVSTTYEVSYLEPKLLLPPIAQLVEHQTSDQEVMSLSLTWGSILFYARLCTVISHCVFKDSTVHTMFCYFYLLSPYFNPIVMDSRRNLGQKRNRYIKIPTWNHQSTYISKHFLLTTKSWLSALFVHGDVE